VADHPWDPHQGPREAPGGRRDHRRPQGRRSDWRLRHHRGPNELVASAAFDGVSGPAISLNDLFARQRRPGWDAMGNEVPSNIPARLRKTASRASPKRLNSNSCRVGAHPIVRARPPISKYSKRAFIAQAMSVVGA
jgi:hypothetical protein